ncbi:MAG: tripartite tricarboxylate transporter TctB family protein [Candidatus Fimivivens sp.]
MMNKQLHRDVWVGSVLLAFCLLVLFLSANISGEASYLPVALSLMMLACAVSVIVNGLRKSKSADGSFHYVMTLREGKHAFLFMFFVFLYYAGFKLLGYWVSTPIFLVFTQKYLRVQSWKTIALVTVIYTAITFILFVVILKLPIYKIGIFGKFFRIV